MLGSSMLISSASQPPRLVETFKVSNFQVHVSDYLVLTRLVGYLGPMTRTVGVLAQVIT